MNLAQGLFYAACVLLAVGGGQKAIQPQDTARALRLAGLAIPSFLVRVGGVAETFAAGMAIFTGAALPAGLVATSYFAFAAFVLRARSLDTPISSCGCFGGTETPPTVAHLGVDLLFGAAGVAIARAPATDLRAVLATQPLGGIPLLAVSGVAAYLIFLLLSPAAQLHAWRRANPPNLHQSR
jgi:hypothetical protein